MGSPLRGRQAEAARNDDRILDAAREVFLADPAAPIAAVAARAGVGISALYRRYAGKEDMLRALARDGLERFGADLRLALADRGDRWDAYADCLRRVLEGRSQGLAQRLAGTFRPTPELGTLAVEVGQLYERLHRRTQRAGALRKDVTSADVVLLLELLMLVRAPGPDDGAGLRRRYLELLLQALRAGASASQLPLPAATDADLSARWRSWPGAPRT